MIRSRVAATPGETRLGVLVLTTVWPRNTNTHKSTDHRALPVGLGPSASCPEQARDYCAHFTATPPLAVCGQSTAVVFLDPLSDDEEVSIRDTFGPGSGKAGETLPGWRSGVLSRYRAPEFMSPSATRCRGSYPPSPAPPLHNRTSPESLEAFGNNLVRSGPTHSTLTSAARVGQDLRPGFVPSCCSPAVFPLPRCHTVSTVNEPD